MTNYKSRLVEIIAILRAVIAVCFFALFGFLAFGVHLAFLFVLVIGITLTNGINLMMGRPSLFRHQETKEYVYKPYLQGT